MSQLERYPDMAPKIDDCRLTQNGESLVGMVTGKMTLFVAKQRGKTMFNEASLNMFNDDGAEKNNG